MASLLAATLVACRPHADLATDNMQRTKEFVTVVGDATASIVRARLEKNRIRTSDTLDDQDDSSLIIIVQDSTVGPLPVHLEIAKLLKQRPHHEYLWVFTNTSMVDDQELIELEILECADILISQGLPGEHVLFTFDSPLVCVDPKYDNPKGWDQIVGHIRQVVE